MAKKDKRRIEVKAPTHQYFGVDFFEDTTENLIAKLQALPKNHKAFLANLEVNNQNQPRLSRVKTDPTWDLIDEYRFDIEGGYDGEIDVILRFYRWETDDEVKKRLAADRKRSVSAKRAAVAKKETEEQKEKELYLQLKKKFEPEKKCPHCGGTGERPTYNPPGCQNCGYCNGTGILTK